VTGTNSRISDSNSLDGMLNTDCRTGCKIFDRRQRFKLVYSGIGSARQPTRSGRDEADVFLGMTLGLVGYTRLSRESKLQLSQLLDRLGTLSVKQTGVVE
jgi:hypothetical protein